MSAPEMTRLPAGPAAAKQHGRGPAAPERGRGAGGVGGTGCAEGSDAAGDFRHALRAATAPRHDPPAASSDTRRRLRAERDVASPNPAEGVADPAAGPAVGSPPLVDPALSAVARSADAPQVGAPQAGAAQAGAPQVGAARVDAARVDAARVDVATKGKPTGPEQVTATGPSAAVGQPRNPAAARSANHSAASGRHTPAASLTPTAPVGERTEPVARATPAEPTPVTGAASGAADPTTSRADAPTTTVTAAPELLASALTQATGPSTPAAAAAPSVAGTAARGVPDTQPALVGSLARLARHVDGAHELTVALHPADLGAVQVRAVLHQGALSVTIACTDDAARHAVAVALPDLHARLSRLDGDSGAGVDVRFADPGSGQPGRHDQAPSDPGRRGALSPGRREIDADSSIRRTGPPLTLQRPHLPVDGLDRWM